MRELTTNESNHISGGTAELFVATVALGAVIGTCAILAAALDPYPYYGYYSSPVVYYDYGYGYDYGWGYDYEIIDIYY